MAPVLTGEAWMIKRTEMSWVHIGICLLLVRPAFPVLAAQSSLTSHSPSSYRHFVPPQLTFTRRLKKRIFRGSIRHDALPKERLGNACGLARFPS